MDYRSHCRVQESCLQRDLRATSLKEGEISIGTTKCTGGALCRQNQNWGCRQFGRAGAVYGLKGYVVYVTAVGLYQKVGSIFWWWSIRELQVSQKHYSNIVLDLNSESRGVVYSESPRLIFPDHVIWKSAPSFSPFGDLQK